MLQFKLFVCDVDGTLVGENKILSENNKKAILSAEAEYNLRVVLTSARTADQMQDLAHELKLEQYGGYLLPERGSKLINCRSGQVIEFDSETHGKAPAIKYLLEKLDLVRNELIAVGDSHSDVALIQLAGLGAVVADAPEPVKACADYITLAADNDGVAHLLHKHILRAYEPVPYTAEDINELSPGTLMENLGIRCTSVARGYIEATMPVDHRTAQPMGILHGGASLALAETIAGFGSVVVCEPGELQVGMQVSGNHVSSALVGDTLRAEARIMHQGRSTHVWTVEIYSQNSNKLISTVRVLNSIIKQR